MSAALTGVPTGAAVETLESGPFMRSPNVDGADWVVDKGLEVCGVPAIAAERTWFKSRLAYLPTELNAAVAASAGDMPAFTLAAISAETA